MLLAASDHIVSFGISYLIHSTLWIGCTWILISLFLKGNYYLKDLLYKAALVGSLLSTTGSAIKPYLYEGSNSIDKSHLEKLLISDEIVLTEHITKLVSNKKVEDSSIQSITLQTNNIDKILLLFIDIWLVLSILIFLKIYYSHLFFFRTIKERSIIDCHKIYNIYNKILKSTKLNLSIKLSESSNVESPILIANKEICIPSRVISNFSDSELEAVIAHEIGHIVRRDYYWNLFFTILRSVFFFQPLVKIAINEIEESSEFLCDRWAVSITKDSISLASSLVNIADCYFKSTKSLMRVSGLTFNKSLLSSRVKSLIEIKNINHDIRNEKRHALCVFLLIGLVMICLPSFTFLPDVDILSTFTSKDDCKEFVIAVESGDLNKVSELLKYRNPNCNFCDDGFPSTPLSMAASKGNVTIGKLLLENGANPYFRSIQEPGVFIESAQSGNIEFADLLLESKGSFDIIIADHGTPLQGAIKYDRKEMVEYLLSKGVMKSHHIGSSVDPITFAKIYNPNYQNILLDYANQSL